MLIFRLFPIDGIDLKLIVSYAYVSGSAVTQKRILLPVVAPNPNYSLAVSPLRPETSVMLQRVPYNLAVRKMSSCTSTVASVMSKAYQGQLKRHHQRDNISARVGVMLTLA